ncbi:hypothetical protein CWE04_08925 [Thomasclavelia cocleata]|uniref:Uncharacterized protein n=1 Tax=Thomasclavelia cocleata TaxID=69824 RepID=A0A1I0GR54_9FIRM|nr:hypothetical protein [Thomasclavelia cocleata]MCR1960641.1 hypothetical protein [Thomasclavelia cocleata]NDO43266.1 hypothetical protein [Thomasclavelia cocleata]PJN80283.1 hypothetical protein CWE04_08925 [Thomasclavelia cocleata]SET73508.1 hypothetical protein SAMN04489758_1349 [Thomasclavelia cocleata]
MIDLILYRNEKKYSLRDDFKMRILSYHISAPEVITNIVAIPYSNNYIDLTEVYGKPTYQQRVISINVDSVEKTELWHKYIEELFNTFHGQRVNAVITSDSEYYYEGRVSIEVDSRNDNLVNQITINILANPFKKHYLNDEDKKL